jgi:hypothetical protein
MSKDDSILFGAKRAGITWLFKFDCAARLKRARAGAARLGMTLAELECRRISGMSGASKLPPDPKTWKYEDRKTAKLKIKIVECDDFTRRCLERQAANDGCNSVEEYMVEGVFALLECDEELSIYDPQTEEAVLTNLHLGDLWTCKIDKGAASPFGTDYPFRQTPIKRIPARSHRRAMRVNLVRALKAARGGLNTFSLPVTARGVCV